MTEILEFDVHRPDAPPRVVLFDLDGTLVNTKSLYMKAYRRAVQPYIRKDMTPERIRALQVSSELGFIRAVVHERDFKACVTDFYAAYESLHDEFFQGVYPGIPEVLDSIRRSGRALGLVTGKSRRSWEITGAVAELGPFDALVFDDDVRAPKPDPHGLELALAALDAAPAEAAYVGDSRSDMQAARSAGLRPVAALWSRDPDARPDHLRRVEEVGATPVERPGQLLEILAL